MKGATLLMLVAVALVGCAKTPSRYAADPRARCVGPAYLEAIDKYPRDASTEYFYPVFTATPPGTPLEQIPGSGVSSEIEALLTTRPPVPADVAEKTGQGWPELEAAGLPFFCQ